MAGRRWDVGILGATGMVGQQFVRRLESHPWFRLTWLAASERSAGRRYGELPWRLTADLPAGVRDLRVDLPTPGVGPQLVFSALDADVAAVVEPAFAAAGHIVVSNTRTFRMDADVPLVIPEVNADHVGLIDVQRRQRGWRGAIVTNPNCSTVFLAMALAALRPFGLRRVVVTTLQAASGAGYPGVASWDLLGNVVPFIGGEEPKIETETARILGALIDDQVVPHSVRISATATRVAVLDGHTESVSVELVETPSAAEVIHAFRTFAGRPQLVGLPTAPAQPIVYLEAQDRPQPRLDADRGDGMTVTIGRVRACPVFSYRFLALGHNTVRGAAGAALLNAELLAEGGYLDGGVATC